MPLSFVANADNAGELRGEFYVETPQGLETRSASQLVEAFESGALDPETSLWIDPEQSPRPARTLLRDLVFLAYYEQLRTRSSTGQERRVDAHEQAFEDAPVGMLLADVGGRITRVNQAFADLLGRAPEAFVGDHVAAISVKTDRERERELGSALLRGELQSFEIGKRFIASSGEEVPCTVRVSLVRDDNDLPQSVVASVLDNRIHDGLAELKSMAAQASAIQILARGVAHDFNNALTVIGVSTSVLEAHPGLLNHESLLAIRQATQLVGHLTDRLETLSGTGVGDCRPLDLTEEVRRRDAFLRGLVGSERRLQISLPERPCLCWLDATAVDQLLINLVMNARQATEPGGRVEIRVWTNGTGVRLEVEDDGNGMSPEVQERIMEPYYTRRRGGSGLGLAIVGATLARVGGDISFRSATGRGTVCAIQLRPPPAHCEMG